MKRHAAKKEQKTVDASEKVTCNDFKIFVDVKIGKRIHNPVTFFD